MGEKDLPLEPILTPEDFDALPEGDGVMIISREGRVMAANLQAERILQRKIERRKTFDITQVVTEEYRSQAEEALKEALREGLSHSNLVARLSLHSGIPVSLNFSINPMYDADDQVIGAVLTFRDIHGGRGPTKVLQDQLIGYDALFEQLAEGVFTINNRWRITSFNKQAQEITGFLREEVLGRYCWDIFRSDLCRSDCPLKMTMETGVVRMDQDVRIVIKGGHQRSILVNTSVIKNKRGLVVGAVETFRPLTLADTGEESRVGARDFVGEIVGESKPLTRILQLLPDVAASDATVIVEGESGTGKELIAKAIHQQSPRSKGPFVPVNCSALAETLLESELFGHVKGAFTGAVTSKVGRFELAKGGTLFLDEIGEIKPEIQIKLLRVLEERVFERVGGTRPIPMDTRIIAATNKELLKEVREGRFREDLFYRLRTVPLFLPSLRERKSDIPMLVNYFIAKFNKKYRKQVRGIDPKVLTFFNQYSWPGNIRELERTLEHAFVFAKGPIITLSHLPELREKAKPKEHHEPDQSAQTYLWEDEKIAIEDILRKTGGRRDEAARILGISRTSLWRKMKAHGII